MIGRIVGAWKSLTMPYSVAEEPDQRLGAPNRVAVVVATLNSRRVWSGSHRDGKVSLDRILFEKEAIQARSSDV